MCVSPLRAKKIESWFVNYSFKLAYHFFDSTRLFQPVEISTLLALCDQSLQYGMHIVSCKAYMTQRKLIVELSSSCQAFYEQLFKKLDLNTGISHNEMQGRTRYQYMKPCVVAGIYGLDYRIIFVTHDFLMIK